MNKILLVVGIIPFIIAYFVAQFFGAKRLLKKKNLPKKGGEVAQAMLPFLEVLPKNMWIGNHPVKKTKMFVPKTLVASSHLNDVAKVVHLCGLVLLQEVHEKSVKLRYRTLKFTTVFPLFVVIILGFALLVKRVSPMLALACISMSLGLVSVTLLMNLAIEREAAKRGIEKCKEMQIFQKYIEIEELEVAVMGVAYLHALPLFMHRFVKLK